MGKDSGLNGGRHSAVLEFYHIFKGFVCYFYVKHAFCSLDMSVYFVFSAFTSTPTFLAAT